MNSQIMKLNHFRVSSIAFPKKSFTIDDAKDWLSSEKYKSKKSSENDEFWIFPQISDASLKTKGLTYFVSILEPISKKIEIEYVRKRLP